MQKNSIIPLIKKFTKENLEAVTKFIPYLKTKDPEQHNFDNYSLFVPPIPSDKIFDNFYWQKRITEAEKIHNNLKSFTTLELEKTRVKGSVKGSVKIIELINNNSRITAKTIVEILGISLRAVEKQIAKLQQQGILKRIGPAKGGYWTIIEKNYSNLKTKYLWAQPTNIIVLIADMKPSPPASSILE